MTLRFKDSCRQLPSILKDIIGMKNTAFLRPLNTSTQDRSSCGRTFLRLNSTVEGDLIRKRSGAKFWLQKRGFGTAWSAAQPSSSQRETVGAEETRDALDWRVENKSHCSLVGFLPNLCENQLTDCIVWNWVSCTETWSWRFSQFHHCSGFT